MFVKGFKKTSQDTAGTIARAGGGPPINQRNMAALQAGFERGNTQTLASGWQNVKNEIGGLFGMGPKPATDKPVWRQ